MPHLVIFGGTGPSGQCLIEEALSRNYTITIYARSPSKLPNHITSSPSVTIIQGTLTDHDAIARAVDGVDAVLSTLGPSLSLGTAVNGLKDHGTPITDGYKVILSVMREKGVKRLIALGTVSNETQQDGHSVITWGMVTAVWVFLHSAWKDVVEFGKAIQNSEGIDWTIARVGRLTNGGKGNVTAGYVGKSGSGICLARKDLGKWFLDELENGKWVHQLPIVYSK
jgi:putative NADH-flavin reductase